MDWLERISGLSPDGGSGSTELLLLGVACVLVAVLLSAPARALSASFVGKSR